MLQDSYAALLDGVPLSDHFEAVNVATNIALMPLVERALGEEDVGENEGGDDVEQYEISFLSQRTSSLAPSAFPTSSASATPSVSHSKPSPSRHQKQIAYKKTQSKRRRSTSQKAKAELLPSPAFKYRLRPGPRLKEAGPAFTSAKLISEDLPAASGSWVGKNIRPTKTRVWSKEECSKHGLKCFNWDGRTPHVLTDNQGRCIATLAGRLNGTSWDHVITEANASMICARCYGESLGAFKPSDIKHRRGRFAALACGISYGGGQVAPGNLVHSQDRRAMLESLLGNQAIKRISGFQSSAFAYYAPKIYQNYAENLEQLHSHLNDLDINFSNSIFPACTFNLGPNTITHEHTDPGNVAYGMCAVTALGDYDPDMGGHLILFDVGLMIRFPPGSTILLPSSILRHGNTPIQTGECRMSFTQYCAGGLFRWVKYGFQTAESLLKTPGGKDVKERLDGSDGERALEALGLFSKLNELDNDRKKVFSGDRHSLDL